MGSVTVNVGDSSMSTHLIKILVVEYLIIFAVCLWEKKYPWALYWWSAATLTVAILWMGNKGE